jgi:molybdopterin-guanine dinucleotide biosynthesis protein A
MGGIVAALRASPHELLAVVAVDMPFVSGSVLKMLAELRREEQIVIPKDDYGLQPLHAVYHQDALRGLDVAIQKRLLSLADMVTGLNHRIVDLTLLADADPSGRFAFNINAEADLHLM